MCSSRQDPHYDILYVRNGGGMTKNKEIEKSPVFRRPAKPVRRLEEEGDTYPEDEHIQGRHGGYDPSTYLLLQVVSIYVQSRAVQVTAVTPVGLDIEL
ncbi:hypothetical protein ACFX2C_006709 [Malus domestica]